MIIVWYRHRILFLENEHLTKDDNNCKNTTNLCCTTQKDVMSLEVYAL